jgi:hypothetical protein
VSLNLQYNEYFTRYYLAATAAAPWQAEKKDSRQRRWQSGRYIVNHVTFKVTVDHQCYGPVRVHSRNLVVTR